MKKRVICVSFIFFLLAYPYFIYSSFDEDIFAQVPEESQDLFTNITNVTNVTNAEAAQANIHNHAQDHEQEDFIPDDDDNFSQENNTHTTYVNTYVNRPGHEYYPQSQSVPQDSILSLIAPSPNNIVTPIVNMPALLKNNIYKRTHPITTRSLLDLPSLEPFWFDPCNWSFTAQPFYNQTSRLHFANNCQFLISYLDLANKQTINELNTTLKQEETKNFINCNLENMDLAQVSSLFYGITLQQRRLGLMFGLSKRFNNTVLSLTTPIYYLENNFFINPDQVDQIKFNPYLRMLNADGSSENSNEEEVREFFIRRLLCDRIGVGDTRVRLLNNIYNSPRTQAWLGIQFTVPTAHSFTRGILGGRFDDYACQPKFSLQRLFNLTPLIDVVENRSDIQQKMATVELTTISQEFLLSALDRLSTLLLNTKLGNNRHTGIGPRFDLRCYCNDYLGMHTTAEFEYYTRRRQRRFFRITKNKHDFERNFQEPTDRTKNIAFLDTQIINTLFPLSICVNVHPGFRVQARHWLTYDSLHWHGSLGFDFWYQHRETLEGVSCKLAKKHGIKQAAYQGKAFGAFGYYGSSRRHRATWHILFTGDITCIYKNIGRDFTLGIRIGVDF